MRLENRTVKLKDGRPCLLKSPAEEDAEEMIVHLRQTSGETDFMARYEDEIRITPDEEKRYLSGLLADPRSLLITALIDGRVAAAAGFNPVSPNEKYRHRAVFGISVKKAYWGLGVGSSVLEAVIEAAKAAGYGQLELEVVSDNERAVALYQKHGFIIYGTRERSFLLRDGSCRAEHLLLLKL
ncbi:GNAT family N-acetyltransferase [Papillibacter cinnamivorans]|uniref:L-amino acid N-acyltransferase YncA n=1 Tax=Papillibacter cinnamivorans DSM 12816 TaxID=1122930 RepID=A0A1W2BHW5_9FIRM|nr:GNAT family N-acetyltransferase [Papillibacter cinnamivorans]SMC72471.1 L-amino acid N-acyltransferase YncA [Papillibacter cinnamivorans DSM 12816]